MMEFGIGAKVEHPKYGEGVIYSIEEDVYHIFFREEDKEIAKSYEGLELLETAKIPDNSISLEDIKAAVNLVFDERAESKAIIELGDKWEGGTMLLQPNDDSLKPKEIPIETFFGKIVMTRDRLRVLEQNINSNKTLSSEEKVHLQQYITKVYGTLTTFNVLFKNREDYFVGESKK